ncbi:serine/threonine-protein kinase [Methanotorris formicicus]|uniref:Serine/threonine protein kinase n=1 Tax=Methanotorris formicicus Mc-S-70 TaxID=647171 RepID=H1L0Z2_9EURY|nr:serine/threonine-protein kinase [Methanotorris formicicus]EHP84298.1 serine/threonine protein kinase [Methanotorris formicicus Mc-S-70]
MIREVLREIDDIERFLNKYKDYLGEDYIKYQKTLSELKIKARLKEIELKIKKALSLKSDKEYSRARVVLKDALALLENLEDETINKKIKTFNNQINLLKIQIENELLQIKNLLLGDESTINIHINPINMVFNIEEDENLKKLKQLLSKYQNPVKIGEGGFAYIFRVVKNNKIVAIKVPKELTELTGKIFLREIENWKKLNHINIVKLYDYNIHPYPYIEMEYCETDLNKIKNKLNLRDALMLIFEVLNGLKYAHNKGIIHKDLKPSNILISNGIPKITDWDLAREETSKSTTINALTLQYSAPEQITRTGIDKRTDIYQIGIILYELTTKQLPFKGDAFDIMESIKNKTPPKPSQINPLIDEELERIILKCIQKDKNKRYQSVGELQKDLANYLNMQLTTELNNSKSKNDFSRSMFYCADLVLFHLNNNDLPNALKYLYDLKYYAKKYCSEEIIKAIDNLINGLEYRIKEGIKEPSDDLKIMTKIVVEKVKMRF